MRYFLELSYNGTPYHGWQRQPNAISVQEVLEDSLSLLLRRKIEVMGAGRTDTGVHARQIMVHFDSEVVLDTVHFKYKLNSLLPKEIAVQMVSLVKEDAHARFDAVSRSYEYIIALSKDPFRINSAYYLKKELDIDLMNEAAKLLLNYTNFKCFSKSKTDVKTYNCNITDAVWEKTGDVLVFKISANRFLRNMVRAIVGTLIEIGEHKLDLNDLKRIIKSENRSEAGYSVPAHGLYLTEVQYPKTIYLI
ncbi:tRNA pseudouridine(38-40) synthase TruA [uncultured Aquimarina sp.]|uniref:tRNA pseudouridine(38-40) synthase TruA n=1 Tax=uncultured Aquimarina sp. TaxID=575652 RepID=UPI00262ACAA2|nr:tRNA pseudouridine(38-40) synthase TruA [uncultured Aquimarina sp.]